MTMKTALIFVLGITLTAAISSAHAQTYQWKDSNGRTIISDTPQPGAGKNARTIGGPPPATSIGEKTEEKTAEAPKTMADKDLEFKKRQQEAKEKAEKLAKEQAASAERKENCTRAGRSLAALESNQPMATLGDKGERQIMDSQQRAQEMERARRFMAESCK